MTAQGTSGFMAKGGHWVVAQFICMPAVLFAGPASGRLQAFMPALVVAALLIAAGAIVGIAGVRDLGRNRSVYPAPLAAGELVRHGIYRILRHPLYASLMYLGFGWALLWTSWLTAGLAALMTATLYFKARREEVFLRCKYRDYDEYAGRVKRFVPWVW